MRLIRRAFSLEKGRLVERSLDLSQSSSLTTLAGRFGLSETQLDLVTKLGLELYAQHHIGEFEEE